MVSPKHKAVALTNRKEIINAFNDVQRITPNINSVKLLLNTFNEVHGAKIMSMSSYKTCNDCRIAIRNFFRNIISIWQKTS
jgi:hypothetical protein